MVGPLDRSSQLMERDKTAELDGAQEAAESTENSVLDEDASPDVPNKHWYVIHTYSGYEDKVKTNLERRVESMGMQDKIFRVVLPKREELDWKGGKKRVVPRKIFPGYLLVEMVLSDDSWYVVRNTPGVTGFVGAGNKPVPLDEAEVKAIMRQMGYDDPRPKVAFERGTEVRVVSGPFANFTGVVDEINLERGKLRVILSMFGRETPVEFEFSQVEKID
ncbi:MAG TPA: transcription termination/antitermination protein NusG [Limnochordales bacterium]|nr:transcription termination/antitermination protein NusG [Limnochordales bacterium]